MWQRIQTIFLLLFIIITAILMNVHFLKVIADGQLAVFISYKLEYLNNSQTLINTFPITVLLMVSILFALFAIIKYKNRKLQMRICAYNILLMIGFLGMVTFYLWAYKENLAITKWSFTFSSILPLVNIILLILAYRSIWKDELLIKSYDRLR